MLFQAHTYQSFLQYYKQKYVAEITCDSLYELTIVSLHYLVIIVVI